MICSFKWSDVFYSAWIILTIKMDAMLSMSFQFKADISYQDCLNQYHRLLDGLMHFLSIFCVVWVFCDSMPSIFYYLMQGLSAGLLRQATYTTARLGSFRWLFVLNFIFSPFRMNQAYYGFQILLTYVKVHKISRSP